MKALKPPLSIKGYIHTLDCVSDKMFDSVIDWVIIVAVILILFGSAKKIPEFARSLGRATGEFNRGKMEIQKEIRDAMNSPPAEQSKVNYAEAAKSFGIDTTGKSDEQLRKEISDKLNDSK